MLAYVAAGWSAIGVTSRTRYRLQLDGDTIEAKGTMIQVMNVGALLRRSWRLAPNISPLDGRLDVLVFRATTLREYLAIVARIVQGRPAASELVLHRPASRVVIDSRPDAPVQLDGETLGRTPVQIEVRPRALGVIVPARCDWARSTNIAASEAATA